jgi:hypothetical protein
VLPAARRTLRGTVCCTALCKALLVAAHSAAMLVVAHVCDICSFPFCIGAGAHCIKCHKEHSLEHVKAAVFADDICYCTSCG